MRFLTSFTSLLSLGAAAPLVATFPCGFESTTQVGHTSFLEWVVQIPEQLLPQFKWYNKRSESAIESKDPPIYSLPSLPKRSKTGTDSGDSIEEPDSPLTDPAPIPKRSEAITEFGESVDEPDSPSINPGDLPKKSEAITESGASVDEPDSPSICCIRPGKLP